MLQLNLFSAQSRFSYMEVLGTVGILPFLALVGWRKLPSELRFLLILVPPIWFGVHYWKVVAWESRLFLVPVVSIFLPAALIVVNASSRPEPDREATASLENPDENSPSVCGSAK
jgi:hypothetical protein